MGWPGCCLRISRACRTGRAPRWSKTCHQPCRVSTDTPRTQSCSRERSHNWSHSATFRLTSTLHVPYQTPLGATGDMLGVQSKPTEPLGCCVAHVLQQMGLQWREESLMTSVWRPGWQGRAPDRRLQSSMLALGKQGARDLSTVAE